MSWINCLVLTLPTPKKTSLNLALPPAGSTQCRSSYWLVLHNASLPTGSLQLSPNLLFSLYNASNSL